jgi:hypothetical protein
VALPESITAGTTTGHATNHVEAHKLINSSWISVRDTDYSGGASGVSGSDATAVVNAALTAAPDGGVVFFPPYASNGTRAVYDISTVALPNKELTLWMYGARINSTAAASYVFTQANRKRLTLKGGTFTGSGNGVSYSLATSDVQSYDFSAEDVSFDLPAAKTAMNLVGLREGTITNCWFDNCTGIYLNKSVNFHLVGCQFRNCTKGVYCDGSGVEDAHSAGTLIQNCTALGCGHGIHAISWDHISIINSMIDYCDRPVLLVNPTGAQIVYSYFSNRDVGSSAFPAIDITTDAGQPYGFAQHTKVTGNIVVCHNTATTEQQSIGIRCSSEYGIISDNTIHFWQQYGIQTTGPRVGNRITGNRLAGVGTDPTGLGPLASVRVADNTNANTWVIAENQWNKATSNIGAAVTRENFTL